MNLAWMGKQGKRLHFTLSNLPLVEWRVGVTLCHRTGPLYRIPAEQIVFQSQVCQRCMAEVNHEQFVTTVDEQRAKEAHASGHTALGHMVGTPWWGNGAVPGQRQIAAEPPDGYTESQSGIVQRVVTG